jgi:hypothetical protein
MFKFAMRIIGVIVIAGIIFLALAIWEGGKPFRWLGSKSEQAGETIKKKSEEAAGVADKIRNKSESLRSVAKRVAEGVKKAEEKIRDITGAKKEK